MRRSLPIVVVIALLGTGGALLQSGGASAEPSKSQKLFRTTLLDDDKTSSAIKSALESNAAIVARDVKFADVTGDGRSDAIVRVETGGVSGTIAVYILSTHGLDEDADLVAVFRSQRLYRAIPAPEGGGLMMRAPKYDADDDVCCPAKLSERLYTWSKNKKTLVLRSSRDIDGPGASADDDDADEEDGTATPASRRQ